MDRLLADIVDDDRLKVKELLQVDGGLATRLVQEARLYQSKIHHWLYVGDTVLHLATAGYRLEIVRLLLAAGADPNAASNHRRSTPLHYAADGFITGPAWDGKRQVRMLRCLLDAGAAINAQDKNGATALHRAVRTRCAAAVQFLLQAGATPTLKNKPGSTAFHLAVQDTGRGGSGADVARAAQRRIIEAFISFGVSKALKDGKGKSVLDCARSSWIRRLLCDDAGEGTTRAARVWGTDSPISS
jgi:Ankyrin repeats (many copies)/Ankyrin repeats (3 copies)